MIACAMPGMRVVIAEDVMLMRAGLARLLRDAGFEVAGEVATPEALLHRVAVARPHVALVDIKMPPTHTDEGIVAAVEIRDRHPETGVLVLSQYLDSRYALRLLEHSPTRVGYLLKDRVSELAILVDAIQRVAGGECVLDPAIVTRLVARLAHARAPLAELTEREREVLALMAEGRSDRGIADRLVLSHKTVEAHVRTILRKLDLPATADDNRRVLAVLEYLRS
jgi:DNA-binding NarL/FixJ family response regulator